MATWEGSWARIVKELESEEGAEVVLRHCAEEQFQRQPTDQSLGNIDPIVSDSWLIMSWGIQIQFKSLLLYSIRLWLPSLQTRKHCISCNMEIFETEASISYSRKRYFQSLNSERIRRDSRCMVYGSIFVWRGCKMQEVLLSPSECCPREALCNKL